MAYIAVATYVLLAKKKDINIVKKKNKHQIVLLTQFIQK